MLLNIEQNFSLECRLAVAIKQPNLLLATMQELCREFHLAQFESQSAQRLKVKKAKKASSAPAAPEYVAHPVQDTISTFDAKWWWADDDFNLHLAYFVRHVCGGIIAVCERSEERSGGESSVYVFRYSFGQSGSRRRVIYCGCFPDVEFAINLYSSLLTVVCRDAIIRVGSIDRKLVLTYLDGFVEGIMAQAARRWKGESAALCPLQVELQKRETEARNRVSKLLTSNGNVSLDWNPLMTYVYKDARREGLDRGLES